MGQGGVEVVETVLQVVDRGDLDAFFARVDPLDKVDGLLRVLIQPLLYADQRLIRQVDLFLNKRKLQSACMAVGGGFSGGL